MFDHVWIILHLHILFMFLIFQTIHRAAYFSPTQSFLSQWGEPIFLRRLGVSVSKYLGTIWNYDCGINHETSWLMITILIILNPFTYASWTTHCVSTGIAEALGVGVQCVGPTSGGGCLIGSPPSPVGATYPHQFTHQSWGSTPRPRAVKKQFENSSEWLVNGEPHFKISKDIATNSFLLQLVSHHIHQQTLFYAWSHNSFDGVNPLNTTKGCHNDISSI